MFDIDALEAAGFTKLLSTEEWEATHAGLNPLVDYRLSRGDVLLTTEQNTQEQDASGLSTTVRYPEIAVLENLRYPGRRVTCDAADTELILLLAEEIVRTPREARRAQMEGNTNG
jgi:hypothetical protein